MDCPILGMIKLFPFSYIPYGWAACNGSIINIQSNAALYSLLGTQFGGNGSTTFGLPDLRGAELDSNTVYCIAIQGIYPQRQ
ncbi:phage tail protein [Ruminiclostridium cellulolyticum]|uniref:Tail Collar domain protein n=1 Tax=Ruminiclostridium cellulolyticum (strain ATCC 35319 / DSM 5812 / JCM 6584 / H10) TaxID=394503 RepID=B8I656_RUMCH|nr:tail fiber protein [Ruminiclostridium cellulolyticum]ACL76821.1 Tail Collar domain protein [Ruminiclostridium cellulolyticum H10]